MLPEDHYQTPSHSRQNEYPTDMVIEIQRQLIIDGQFDVAQDLDIALIREKFATKYDTEIADMLIYTVEQCWRQDFGEWSDVVASVYPQWAGCWSRACVR